MSSQQFNLIFWLRAALKTALVLALVVFVTSVILTGSLSPTLEWPLFAAALGGPLGSLQYREALSVPAFSRHSWLIWLLSVAWATAFLLASLKAAEPYPTDQASLLFKLLAMGGMAVVLSLMCFIPLKWLQGAGRPRHAP